VGVLLPKRCISRPGFRPYPTEIRCLQLNDRATLEAKEFNPHFVISDSHHPAPQKRCCCPQTLSFRVAHMCAGMQGAERTPDRLPEAARERGEAGDVRDGAGEHDRRGQAAVQVPLRVVRGACRGDWTGPAGSLQLGAWVGAGLAAGFTVEDGARGRPRGDAGCQTQQRRACWPRSVHVGPVSGLARPETCGKQGARSDMLRRPVQSGLLQRVQS
jgi:hypothetical protein